MSNTFIITRISILDHVLDEKKAFDELFPSPLTFMCLVYTYRYVYNSERYDIVFSDYSDIDVRAFIESTLVSVITVGDLGSLVRACYLLKCIRVTC